LRYEIYEAFTQVWFEQETRGWELKPEECENFCVKLACCLLKNDTLNVGAKEAYEDDNAICGLYYNEKNDAYADAAPMRCTGGSHSFIHKSIYEYFVALGMVREMEGPSLVQNPLNGTAIWNQRLLSQRRPGSAILLFVADYGRIDAETRQFPLTNMWNVS